WTDQHYFNTNQFNGSTLFDATSPNFQSYNKPTTDIMLTETSTTLPTINEPTCYPVYVHPLQSTLNKYRSSSNWTDQHYFNTNQFNGSTLFDATSPNFQSYNKPTTDIMLTETSTTLPTINEPTYWTDQHYFNTNQFNGSTLFDATSPNFQSYNKPTTDIMLTETSTTLPTINEPTCYPVYVHPLQSTLNKYRSSSSENLSSRHHNSRIKSIAFITHLSAFGLKNKRRFSQLTTKKLSKLKENTTSPNDNYNNKSGQLNPLPITEAYESGSYHNQNMISDNFFNGSTLFDATSPNFQSYNKPTTDIMLTETSTTLPTINEPTCYPVYVHPLQSTLNKYRSSSSENLSSRHHNSRIKSIAFITHLSAFGLKNKRRFSQLTTKKLSKLKENTTSPNDNYNNKSGQLNPLPITEAYESGSYHNQNMISDNFAINRLIYPARFSIFGCEHFNLIIAEEKNFPEFPNDSLTVLKNNFIKPENNILLHNLKDTNNNTTNTQNNNNMSQQQYLSPSNCSDPQHSDSGYNDSLIIPDQKLSSLLLLSSSSTSSSIVHSSIDFQSPTNLSPLFQYDTIHNSTECISITSPITTTSTMNSIFSDTVEMIHNYSVVDNHINNTVNNNNNNNKSNQYVYCKLELPLSVTQSIPVSLSSVTAIISSPSSKRSSTSSRSTEPSSANSTTVILRENLDVNRKLSYPTMNNFNNTNRNQTIFRSPSDPDIFFSFCDESINNKSILTQQQQQQFPSIQQQQQHHHPTSVPLSRTNYTSNNMMKLMMMSTLSDSFKYHHLIRQKSESQLLTDRHDSFDEISWDLQPTPLY
ncbi:uncharacterized protein DC041_0009665, partial [Schistosoma bovis]